MVQGPRRGKLCLVSPKNGLGTEPGEWVMRQHKNAYIDAAGKSMCESLWALGRL